ncbi:hypothetical protein [Stratiformator vulcanicus]|uniref:Uncharacterized protein n=1 Tax=Stratiformator vulcanicus TaxID=2527980 RepID=A0A517R1F1_9PLAN|nr:hypothetical protein [Stratiformator vulcanicus]QDT37674.1 hypothetical protein Pan189_20560 [Stratiformator vulcanicus]
MSTQNFGYLIAYLLPGFIVLWAVQPLSDVVRAWVAGTGQEVLSFGGFMYGTIASVGLGMLVSTVRWMLVDSIHHATGVRRPNWDFSKLQSQIAAFERIVEDQYRYYQFYANSLVAVIAAYLIRRLEDIESEFEVSIVDGLALGLALILFLGSRDTLKKYYARVDGLLKT